MQEILFEAETLRVSKLHGDASQCMVTLSIVRTNRHLGT